MLGGLVWFGQIPRGTFASQKKKKDDDDGDLCEKICKLRASLSFLFYMII